ncbi:MAG: M13 family metallopeptidase, partial [Asticcacaulis sp.]|nr:M13 family metallopeptidase [Asticcacaulis sp.]
LNATDFQTDNIFGLWAEQGFEDADHVVPYLMQGGLGMPDRDYYLDPSPKMAEYRTKYVAHIANLLKLAGIGDADAKAKTVMALETAMAATHVSRADSIEVQKANNPWTRADFAVKAPGLDWDAYFEAASLDGQPNFIIWHPSAVTGISALVASQPLDTWKTYLTVRLLDHYSPVLPKAFADENFDFYGHTLLGTPQIRERWKRAIDATNDAMGEAVGQLYAARYFPPESKAKIQAMVQSEIAAYHTRIANLTWMSPATKDKALAKLATLRVSVGYPDTWTDYGDLQIVRGDAIGNLKRAELFNYRKSLAKLGQKPDHGEWVMTPQTVDAVNLPLANALNFPAAILQPLYFDPQADAA